MGSSERTSSRFACGWWSAVRLPGQLPDTTTRCWTRPGWRSANCRAEVAPAEKAITSVAAIPSPSSKAANASA